MLTPSNRALLTDELTPPHGFELSHAVGTSFTLDLAAALTVPIALSSTVVEDDPDATSIMAALLRINDRIDVFAQAGAWGFSGRSDLVSLLETSIHPVVPHGGIFHPKIWLLEFRRGQELRYRIICSSRNLTFDRSWDAMIAVDGVPSCEEPPKQVKRRNRPLAALVQDMSGRAQPALNARRRHRLQVLSQRLLKVEWDFSGYYDLQFHVFGLPEKLHPAPKPDLSSRHTLVVSPFVTNDGLAYLRHKTPHTELVSRAESLASLDLNQNDAGLSTFVFDSYAQTEVEAEPTDHQLSGLHAKIVACQRGFRGHLFLGSSNATSPGWRKNTEVMVELEGRRDDIGPDAIRKSLERMLEPYKTSLGHDDVPDEGGIGALERRLMNLASIPWTIRISGSEHHVLEVFREGGNSDSSGDHDLSWHLLTRDDLGGIGLPGTEEIPTVLHDVPLTDITPFIRVTVTSGSEKSSTILLAALVGDPPQRREAVLTSQIQDTTKLLELLMMLLQLNTRDAEFMVNTLSSDYAGSSVPAAEMSFPGLMEALLQALTAGAEGMAEAERILRYVRSAPGAPALPENFLDLWDAAWDAHQLHNQPAESGKS